MVSESYLPLGKSHREQVLILVVVEDGQFFDVGLEDMGRRTGLNYA